jgi:carbamoyltransferase
MAPNIIGISSYFHDSACCLLRDGALVAAAEEERFSRAKHDPGIPAGAFRYCLRQASLAVSDLDCVAYYEDPVKKLARQLWMSAQGQPLRADAARRMDGGRPRREIRDLLGFDGEVVFVDHHQAHAASSFFFSGFPDAAILTVDGVGEWATTTYGRAEGADIELFEEVSFPDSLGLLYSAITAYLGFSVNDGEYKVMGLAPYGSTRYADQVRKLVQIQDGGQYRLDMKYFDYLRGNRMYSDALVELFGQPAREAETDILQFHQDVARSLQAVLEEVLLDKVKYLHRKVPSENLCMAGGVALNCVANGVILREGPFKRLFVQPAAGDSGGALGAAALAHVKLTGRRPGHKLEHVYLGPAFSNDEVRELVEAAPLKAHDFTGRESDLLEATAQRLAAGKVIGWFHGRMEFGPRALGARSILADPRDSGMRDRINALVKMREAFRPFAPAVLEEDAAAHFDLDHASPFMLETCDVISPLDLPAITHVDRSARVQTVSARQSPRYHALIAAFKRATGCPILLNTSFNMRDEPIVCTPQEALICFVRSDIDCLVLEDFLIDRADVPDSWPSLFRQRFTGKPSVVAHDVYTFL